MNTRPPKLRDYNLSPIRAADPNDMVRPVVSQTLRTRSELVPGSWTPFVGAYLLKERTDVLGKRVERL
jgi:hypothetical protein